MNNLLITLIALTIIHLVLYAFGALGHYKETKKFLSPAKNFVNMFHALRWYWKAVLGMEVPRLKVNLSDSKMYRPTLAMRELCIFRVHERLIALGYTREDYEKNLRDCDNNAFRMMVEADDLIYLMLEEMPEEMAKAKGCGISVGVFSFAPDTGGRHAVMFMICEDGERYHYEIFPEAKYLTPRPMSKTELSSGYILT